MSRKYDYTVDPHGIPQLGTSKQDLIRVQGYGFFTHAKVSLKGVKAAIWKFCLHRPVKLSRQFRSDNISSFGLSLSNFEIRFTMIVKIRNESL